MYLEAKPIGVNDLDDRDRIPLWKVTSGDDWRLTTKLIVPGTAGTPATPENSRVTFTLEEDRFSPTPLWSGGWLTGITPVDQRYHPGLVVIRIPTSITTALRRGAYVFSLTVADNFGRHTNTVLVGTIQVEYEPTSPTHDIPYR